MATASGIDNYTPDINRLLEEMYGWAEFEYPFVDEAKVIVGRYVEALRLEDMFVALTEYFGYPTTSSGTGLEDKLVSADIQILMDTMINYRAGYNIKDSYEIAIGELVPESFTP